MADKCPVCSAVEDITIEKLYEDDKCVAFLNPKPVLAGHILVIPKEHQPIFEQVPDFVTSHLFRVANKISTALFEGLQPQGTNILVNNGIAAGQDSAHFMIHVIPRKEGDRLNLQWQPKHLTEEEVSTIELQLKEEAAKIGEFQKEKEAPIELKDKKESIGKEEGEDNYMVRNLRRIP